MRRHGRYQVWTKAGLSLVVGLLMASMASCTGPRDASPSEEPVRQAKVPARPGEHWVQSDRLRAVMGRISRSAERWPAAVPDATGSDASQPAPADAEEAFRDAQALADGLSRAAALIPRSVADHPMSAEDRRGFAAEAQRLQAYAEQLRRAAISRKVEPMQRSLDRVASTCVSCHSQYRDFTGELEPRRASSQ